MYERILVPVDGSDTSNRGLDEAVRLARLTGARIRLIHVVDELAYVIATGEGGAYTGDLIQALQDSGTRILADATARVQAAGVAVEGEMFNSFDGRLCDRVVTDAQSWRAQLIVIGTHGRRGARRLLLGSDAEQILRLSPVPVLLVRSSQPPAG